MLLLNLKGHFLKKNKSSLFFIVIKKKKQHWLMGGPLFDREGRVSAGSSMGPSWRREAQLVHFT